MGFQLTIAEGKEAGREFVFEQASVVIGRTSDCDVVLYDPGISRRHARIFIESEACFVEDLGSSNGTKVNGAAVKKHPLADGDRITLGPVIFSYAATSLEAAEPAGLGEDGENSTRIVSVDSLKRQKNKGVALVPKDAAPEQLQQLGRSATTTMQAVSRPRTGTQNPVSRSSTSTAAALATAPEAKADLAARPVLSAAERARIRRQSKGKTADLRIWWAEADEARRRLVFGGAALLGLIALAGVAYGMLAEDAKGPSEAEVGVLTSKPLAQSFGLHPLATFERPDTKAFTFSFTSAVRTVVILHYQAEDISEGEVLINVNGTDVQALAPDTVNAAERSHQVVIPAQLLKKAQDNKVVFDNTKNPPGNEPWRIWNVWVEFVPLPELPPDQLMREAQSTYERGKTNLDRKDVGARNRYDAWKDFRQAWLLLETNPTLNPDLHDLSRFMVERAQQELDKKCSQLLRDIDRYANMHDYEKARSAIDHVKDFFPMADQPCLFTAELRRARYDLW